MGLCAAAVALSVALSCSSDLLLVAGDLEVFPNPAQPGDSVKFVFQLTVVPKSRYVAKVLINDTEHLRLERFEAINGPMEINLGDAADLIARYGEGIHRGLVEVEVTDRSVIARSGERDFLLQSASP
ncbi:hypothetical protein HRbin33_01456 [bacterium HR33]|nr:hypothetical protein HRbin33_01456 [bacterium HR33]